MSAMSEAKKRANKKWNDANMKERYDRVQLVLPKGRKVTLQAAAEQHGQSVNGFINSLIDEALEREGAGPVPAGSPAVEDRPGGGFGFPAGSPGENSSSRFISQWGPDFQTALSDSGQSLEEFVSQAVVERIERERKPLIPQWIAEKYPGERWPVLQAVRAIQGNMNAQRMLHRSMTQEQRLEWDKEFRRELDEERRESAGQDTQKPTCNLPLD